MKEIQLADVLKALKDPGPEQYVEIRPDIADRARASLDRMFELEEEGKKILQQRESIAMTP